MTDVELECLAQTWSEHCKHKIFNSPIVYTDGRSKPTIDSLFKTYIKGSTAKIRKAKGKKDFCLSVFVDNAGVIKFNEMHNLVFKVETHNSPSALDPYGGALTGIVGVNRDPFGTGMGANLLPIPMCSALPRPFTKRNCRPAFCIRAVFSKACAKALNTAATKAASPLSTAASCSTTDF